MLINCCPSRASLQAFFNDNPSADNFGKVRGQIAEVKDIMVENIGTWELLACDARRPLARRAVARCATSKALRVMATTCALTCC